MNQNPASFRHTGMELKFKGPEGQGEKLNDFWAGIFQEVPTCANENCGEVAIEVDSFFPYLDDYNRCEGHRLPEGFLALRIA